MIPSGTIGFRVLFHEFGPPPEIGRVSIVGVVIIGIGGCILHGLPCHHLWKEITGLGWSNGPYDTGCSIRVDGPSEKDVEATGSLWIVDSRRIDVLLAESHGGRWVHGHAGEGIIGALVGKEGIGCVAIAIVIGIDIGISKGVTVIPVLWDGAICTIG